MLLVWSFQFCLNFFVILSTEANLEYIYQDQLQPSFGISRLITSIVMHVLM